jgi:membrane protease YdiL (CAAX protease family)
LGWSGYATDPLQERRGALRAGILLGLVSAVWHAVPLVQAGRSAAWVAWWCLFTVAGRVLIIWVYNNAGKSVLAAALFHATSNISWQLFPNFGSHWDPSIVAPLVVVAAVTFLWGPKTLARYRYGPRHD